MVNCHIALVVQVTIFKGKFAISMVAMLSYQRANGMKKISVSSVGGTFCNKHTGDLTVVEVSVSLAKSGMSEIS